MAKSPDAFRTISEVAEDLDLPQHVLRFWETRFSQIKPMKRGGGRRYYRPDDVDLLRGIRHLLYGEGYTIKGVQRILKDQGNRYVMSIWREEGAPAPSDVNPVALQDLPPQPKQVLTTDIVPSEQIAEPILAAPPSVVTPVTETKADDVVIENEVTPMVLDAVPNDLSSLPTSSSAPANEVSYALRPSVPEHLIAAITTQDSVVEIDEEVAGITEKEEPIPADILVQDEAASRGIAKSLGKGLLGKLTGAESSNAAKSSVLSTSEVDKLQATLIDLLECKRLLDQIR